MLEFVLARYNYWIVIALMMTGLYIVFSRGNLVKTLIGLNLFQTSVFIFYITVGKVIGGTAPILIEDKEKTKKDAHGTDAGHGSESHTEAPSGMVSEATGAHISSMEDARMDAEGLLGDAHELGETVAEHSEGARVHLDSPDILPQVVTPYSEPSGVSAELPGADLYGDIIYSNPLPHVLILTAIVVGVATTSVGLSLAVRIREAYGTVEQDDLEAMDNVNERMEARS